MECWSEDSNGRQASGLLAINGQLLALVTALQRRPAAFADC
jgi:hypothetical protein